MRQICAKRPGSPALDGFQLGVRVSEFPREMSSPRYHHDTDCSVSVSFNPHPGSGIKSKSMYGAYFIESL